MWIFGAAIFLAWSLQAVCLRQRNGFKLGYELLLLDDTVAPGTGVVALLSVLACTDFTIVAAISAVVPSFSCRG